MSVAGMEHTDSSAAGEGRMTLDEAVAYGIARHQAGDLGLAERVYDAVLERDPQRADVLTRRASRLSLLADELSASARLQRDGALD